jgi:hypothetical protein
MSNSLRTAISTQREGAAGIRKTRVETRKFTSTVTRTPIQILVCSNKYMERSFRRLTNAPGGAEGEGEGGSGISNSSLEVHLPDGTVLKPSASDCKQDRDRGVASYFQICTVNHPNLEAGHLIVHMFYLDIGSECSMNFSYRGQDYFVNNQQSPPTNSCGWSDGGFQAFGASLTDVCYFNIASHDPSDTTQGQGSVGTVSQSDLTPGATLSQGSTPTPLRRRTIV